jgi:hypothetical protein
MTNVRGIQTNRLSYLALSTITSIFKRPTITTQNTSVLSDCANSAVITRVLKEKIGKSLTNFTVKKINGSLLLAGLDSGTTSFPFMSKQRASKRYLKSTTL